MKETEKAYKNEQKQNGRQKNFGGKYGVFLALIVLCVLILADIAVNLNRQNAKEELEPEEIVETVPAAADYEEEEKTLAEGSEDEVFEKKEESDAQDDIVEKIADPEESVEGESNINGNTNMNIKNGGWAAEQGDWNYYLFWNSILKENVVTGEKLYLYGFENAGDMRLSNLHVMGEWIYFFSEGMENRMFKLKTDGSEFQSLEGEWIKNVLAWGTWNGTVYVIVKEYNSVQSYTVCTAAVDWENGTYEVVCELFDSDDRFFMGFEEQPVDLDNAIYHYIGVNGRCLYIYRDKNEQAVLAYDLETGELTEYPCGWSFYITNIYAEDSFLYGVGYSVRSGQMGNELIPRSLGFIDLSTWQEYEYNEIGISDYDEINEINRTDDGLMVVGSSDDGISIFNPSDQTVSNVVPDIAGNICVAHNKIYYQCDGRYCEVNVDGSDWKEIREEEFLSVESLKEKGKSARLVSKCKDAYYRFLAENESGFTAEMGEFEKQNEESYQKASAFLLMDLNQDDIPELVVQHPVSYKCDRLYVYTYKSGKVVQMKNIDGQEGESAYIDMNSQANGWYSVSGCGQNHLHVSWNAGDFGLKDSIFIAKKGKLVLYAEREEIDELGVDYHKIEGEEVERGEYIVFLEGCGGDIKELQYNTESNREKYLK